jgi:hypothetical protein
MKKEFDQYLTSLNLTKVQKQKVQEILNYYKLICPEEITEIFICDFFKEDGTRDFSSLWLFSKSFVMESKDFTINNNLDIAPFPDQIRHSKFEFINFNLIKPNENSRITYSSNLILGLECEFKASGDNCSKLMSIFEMYFKPKF